MACVYNDDDTGRFGEPVCGNIVNTFDHLDGVIMDEREMAQGTKISKERKRLAELLDQIQRERGVNISEVDSSQWNDLVRDAQRLLEAEKRQI